MWWWLIEGEKKSRTSLESGNGQRNEVKQALGE